MKLILHSPYGSIRQESGLIFLLGYFLKQQGHSVSQLICDGMCGACDRDCEEGFNRNIDSCSVCIKEQKEFASWAGFPLIRLSNYLRPQEVSLTQEWLSSLDCDEYERVTLNGEKLFDSGRDIFKSRFDTLNIRTHDSLQNSFAKSLLLSAARLDVAARRLGDVERPDMVFVAGGRDLISGRIAASLRKLNVPVAIFDWEISARFVRITNPLTGKAHTCGLYFSDLRAVRNDLSTWPPDMVAMLNEAVEFLGLAPSSDDKMVANQGVR